MADIYFTLGMVLGLYALMQAIAGLFERHITLVWWGFIVASAALAWHGITGQPGGVAEFKFGHIPDIVVRALATAGTIFN